MPGPLVSERMVWVFSCFRYSDLFGIDRTKPDCKWKRRLLWLGGCCKSVFFALDKVCSLLEHLSSVLVFKKKRGTYFSGK